jgi:hypothetical protein
MRDYSFQVYASGPPATMDLTDAIAEEMGGEPDVSVLGGPDVVEFMFDREAETAAAAIASAVELVERHGYTVLGMGPGPLVSARRSPPWSTCPGST